MKDARRHLIHAALEAGHVVRVSNGIDAPVRVHSATAGTAIIDETGTGQILIDIRTHDATRREAAAAMTPGHGTCDPCESVYDYRGRWINAVLSPFFLAHG